MTEDEAFLRAILATPDDRTARLVYADWLDDRADPRAEYVRLGARVAELPTGDAERAPLRARMLALQPSFPSWWLAILGFRATACEPPERIAEAAQLLRRPAQRVVKGYAVTIEAAAVSGLTGAVALLESWSKWNGNIHDITYYLRLSDAAGREASCEPYTYNPYFGCDVKFMEWYGDAVVMIYEEKHSHFACRFGFTGPPASQNVAFRWLLDGRELAFRQYREERVQRLSVPDFAELPPLTEAEARERDLWPAEPH